MNRRWEDLYERHLDLAISNVRYGIKYGSWLGLKGFWINLRAALRCAWYQINS